MVANASIPFLDFHGYTVKIRIHETRRSDAPFCFWKSIFLIR